MVSPALAILVEQVDWGGSPRKIPIMGKGVYLRSCFIGELEVLEKEFT